MQSRQDPFKEVVLVWFQANWSSLLKAVVWKSCEPEPTHSQVSARQFSSLIPVFTVLLQSDNLTNKQSELSRVVNSDAFGFAWLSLGVKANWTKEKILKFKNPWTEVNQGKLT